MDLDHLRGHVHDRFGDFVLLPPPRSAAELREFGFSLRPADVALDQVDPRGGDVQQHAIAELEDQKFFEAGAVSRRLGIAEEAAVVVPADRSLFQRAHAAEAGDSLRHVDDVVAVVEVEEAVDGPRFDLAARRGAGLFHPRRQQFFVKEFVAAEHQYVEIDEAKAGADVPRDQRHPPAFGELARFQHVRQAVDFRFGLAGDPDAILRRNSVEFLPHPQHVAAESLDALDAQVRGRFHARSRHRRDRHRRQLHQLLERARGSEQSHRVRNALEEVLPLLAEIAVLEQRDHRSRREVIEQEPEPTAAGVRVERAEDQQFADFVEAALRLCGEVADRFQIVAEEFEPDGIGGVGWEQVEDAAALAEFAGEFDGIDPLIAGCQ